MNNRITPFLLFYGLVLLLQHVRQKLPVETIDSYPCNVPPQCTLTWSFLISRHICFIFMHLLGKNSVAKVNANIENTSHRVESLTQEMQTLRIELLMLIFKSIRNANIANTASFYFL